MAKWSEERRESVAAEFRKVGGDWHDTNGLTDPRGPLWRGCLGCHRMRTIEKITEPDADDGALWRCGKCGWSGTPNEIYEYQTSLLLDLVETPDCPPIVREVLAACGHLLYRMSRGHSVAAADAGSAARHAVRVLDHYGYWADEDWFYRAG